MNSSSNDKMSCNDSLIFIKGCILKKSVVWTYHVNMRMEDRFISRQMIFDSTESFEIIETYPDDKYLPSCLVHAMYGDIAFHVVFAVDFQKENVRVVTAYRPDITLWSKDLKRRRIL